jgi:hypothetical protein
MKLHTSGVNPGKLGSIQDRINRKFLLREMELEARRLEFQMLTAMTNPDITNDNKRNEWIRTIHNSWKDYIGKLLNVEVPENTPDEIALKEYYDKVVSKMAPKLSKDRRTGKLSVSGLEQLER